MISILQITLELWGSIFALACGYYCLREKKLLPGRSSLLSALLFLDAALLIADSVAYAVREKDALFNFIMVRLSNCIVFLLTPIMALCMAYLLCLMIREAGGDPKKAGISFMKLFCGLNILLVIFSQFTGFVYYFDSNNAYHRASGFTIVMAVVGFELITLACILLRNYKYLSKKDRIVLLLYLFLPAGSALFQTFNYGLSLNNVAITLSLLFLFLNNEEKKLQLLTQRTEELHEQKLLLKESELLLKDSELLISRQEETLAEARLQLSISILKPNFILNTLTKIEDLCRSDPDTASEATRNLSKFLNKTLLRVRVSDLHTLSEELSCIRSYLWLERLRLGDRIFLTENINTREFYLPVLTLLPLVEHGINHYLEAPQEKPLHLSIISEDLGEMNRITFSTDCSTPADEKQKNLFQTAVLPNIESRLALLVNGSLEFEELPGEGKNFILYISKKPVE